MSLLSHVIYILVHNNIQMQCVITSYSEFCCDEEIKHMCKRARLLLCFNQCVHIYKRKHSLSLCHLFHPSVHPSYVSLSQLGYHFNVPVQQGCKWYVYNLFTFLEHLETTSPGTYPELTYMVLSPKRTNWNQNKVSEIMFTLVSVYFRY